MHCSSSLSQCLPFFIANMSWHLKSRLKDEYPVDDENPKIAVGLASFIRALQV